MLDKILNICSGKVAHLVPNIKGTSLIIYLNTGTEVLIEGKDDVNYALKKLNNE